MARFRIPALVRAFKSSTQRPDDVHFHRGPQGRPDACFDTACRRPRLDVD